MGTPTGAPSASTGAPSARASDEAGSGADADAPVARDVDAPFLSGVPTSAKSIGHTSVVFKIELSTGVKAAWKPASRRGPVRYKGEVAAYRLARLLAITNVPRASTQA